MYKYNKESMEKGSIASARTLLEHVMRLTDVGSAVDVGCGIGTFVSTMKEIGVLDAVGIDGEWSPYADIIWNLDDGVYVSDRRFDLAICLEVAEHVKKENELNVVDTLVGLSDVVLFSAAIPSQGGHGHVNEQWPSHWRELFSRYGYVFLDVIRPYIWENKSVFKWYRQNAFMVVRKELAGGILQRYSELSIENKMIDVVHPEYWKERFGIK